MLFHLCLHLLSIFFFFCFVALGVAGLGCEDALQHLFNYLFPNIFETSPHVIGAVMDAIEACRVALGPSIVLHYLLQGLFHPARRVRQVLFILVFNKVFEIC